VLNDLFVMQIPIVEKILRTVLVYAVIVVLFRLTGKRGLAGLNTFDFVVIFLLSNVVQNAVIGNDDSLLGGVVGAVTLVAVNTAINRLIAVSPTAARVFEGAATTVISDGNIDGAAMRRLGLLEPTGQLILRLTHDAEPATRGALASALARLDSIDRQLTAARGHDQG
jgi:uncharacterized membrane protein YcaP (DUF421 family)